MRLTTLIFLVGMGCCIAGIARAESSNGNEDNTWRVINYWSITCAPCRVEIPELNKLSAELDTVGIRVLGVNFDEDDRQRTLELADRMGIEFPTLKQETVEELKIAPPSVLPTTFILSPQGEVRATLIGAQTRDSIAQSLRELLEGRL